MFFKYLSDFSKLTVLRFGYDKQKQSYYSAYRGFCLNLARFVKGLSYTFVYTNRELRLAEFRELPEFTLIFNRG